MLEELEKNEAIGEPTVEEVQDTVERVLIENGFVRTAKSYILYRAERSRVREMNTRLMRIYEDITNKAAVDSDIKRENANINGDTAMGAMLKYGSEGAKQFNLMFVLKPEHAEAHRNGDIHIHDMDFLTLTTTCCQIDLHQAVSTAAFPPATAICASPTTSLRYAALACIAIQANQNDQHGGQSIVNFDYAMAEGVKKTFRKRYRDNLIRALELTLGMEDAEEGRPRHRRRTARRRGLRPRWSRTTPTDEAEAELLRARGVSPEDDRARCRPSRTKRPLQETDRATYQAMEALIHNLNTMNSRAGAQVPFSSINYGMDTSPEARMVMRNLLLAHGGGPGQRRDAHLPHPDLPRQGGRQLQSRRAELRPVQAGHAAARPSGCSPTSPSRTRPSTLQYYKEGHPETEIAYMGCRTRVIGQRLRSRKSRFPTAAAI